MRPLTERRCAVAARLQILPEDMAKLGQLVLNRGRWNGQQLIALEWFDAIMRGSALEPRAGLLWWLIPEHTTFVIDDERIRSLAAAGADSGFIREAKAARGRYESTDAFENALRAAFGEQYWVPYGEARARTHMDPERREYGRMIGYEANGSFGQYIDIYPDQRLVAVRMIAVTDHIVLPTDGFENFRVVSANPGSPPRTNHDGNIMKLRRMRGVPHRCLRRDRTPISESPRPPRGRARR